MPTPRRTASKGRSPTPAAVERRAHATVRRVAPKLSRVTKWANRWYAGRDLIVVIGAFRHHVGVEFWRGSSLPDPDRLLEGTGKNLRHVKLHTLEDASSPSFERLIRSAVALDRRAPPRPR
jgi:hypothetical protein